MRTMYTLIPVLLLLTSGCITPKKSIKGTRPDARELSKKLQDAEDPRKYWIKVYRGKDGPQFIDAHRLHRHQAEEANNTTKRGQNAPTFNLAIRRNQEISSLIDTMSEKNWIEYLTADTYGVRTIGPEPYFLQPKHVKDEVESYIGLLPKVRIGNLHMESVIVNVRPQYQTLGPLNRGLERPDPMMVLGHDFLKPFSFVQFDNLNRIISFSTTSAYRTVKPNVIAALDFRYDAKGLVVQGSTKFYRGDIAIDLAGDYEMAVPYPESIREKQLILGDFVRQDITVSNSLDYGFYANCLPSIGNKLLQDFIVTIDNQKKKIYFELP